VAQVVIPPRLTSLLSTWGADAEAVAEAAAALVARYGEQHRRYHTLEHIEEMLVVTDRLAAPDEVMCAVWFHDAIYEPAAPDNEERSAAYTRELLESVGAPRAFRNEVARLVESTAHHDPDESDENGTMLADADLSILGAPTDRYRRYAADVRVEYSHITDDAWRTGRAALVRTFLDRPRLFHSAELFDEYEQRARDNLRAELVALTTP